MRRKLKNLKNKNGHSENGCSAQQIAEAVYREHRSFTHVGTGGALYDVSTSGWSNASRPRDFAISQRRRRIDHG